MCTGPSFSSERAARAKTAVKMAAFLLFIARLSMTRTPVVRTVHNLRPHEDGNRVERILTNLLERRTSLYVRLNPRLKPRLVSLWPPFSTATIGLVCLGAEPEPLWGVC